MTPPIGFHVPKVTLVRDGEIPEAEVIQCFLTFPRKFAGGGLDTPKKAPSVPLYVHAPYVLNPVADDRRIVLRSIASLQEHLNAAERLGAAGVVVHAGHTKTGRFTERWGLIAEAVRGDVPILVENLPSGPSADVGIFASLASIERLRLCFDTAHAWSAGHLPSRFISGLGASAAAISLVHANGSKVRRGARRDHHESLTVRHADDTGHLSREEVVRAVADLGVPAVVETIAGLADSRWLRNEVAALEERRVLSRASK